MFRVTELVEVEVMVTEALHLAYAVLLVFPMLKDPEIKKKKWIKFDDFMNDKIRNVRCLKLLITQHMRSTQ